VPLVLRAIIEPTLVSLTAYLTLAVHRAAGHAVTLDGASLSTPQGTLDILVSCSGLLGTSRLWVLATLVVALFPTTARQKVAMFASATAVGFIVNVGRIALLALTVMRSDDASFDYWDEGLGTAVFSVGSVAAAGALWWLILRRWPAAASPTLRPST
jgi:exosortase/archaeosortase family protein